MEKINLGIIGCGYWGKNLVRLAGESHSCSLKYCCDLDDELLKEIKNKYPSTILTKDYNTILNDKLINAILVITPTKIHFKVVKDCLMAKKHVFVEKPLTYTSDEGVELIKIAKEKNLTLMVGHVFLYNSNINWIKNYIDQGKLGKINHMHFQRRNLGPIRTDVNALWDLAPHDISIALYLIGKSPTSISCTGSTFLQKKLHDIATLNLKFPGNIAVNIVVSWLDPVKIRDISIVGEKGMLVFDDVKSENKITIHNKFVDADSLNLNIIDNVIPSIKSSEPLSVELEHFLSCIKNEQVPLTDGINGLEVVKILETAQKSLE